MDVLQSHILRQQVSYLQHPEGVRPEPHRKPGRRQPPLQHPPDQHRAQRPAGQLTIVVAPRAARDP